MKIKLRILIMTAVLAAMTLINCYGGVTTVNKLHQQYDTLISDAVQAGAAGKGKEGVVRRAEALEDDAHMFMKVNIGLSLLIAIVALGWGVTFSGELNRRFGNLGRVADTLNSGDLSQKIVRHKQDELGDVSEHFEKMRFSMQTTLQEIDTASEQVAAGSKNISDSSVALSQGAAEQASSVEELSASIAQIASQTRSNADSADKANTLAGETRENARLGNEDMKEMLRAMEEINDSSANISKIIKVIDEIAFQTNILALNAAVEAARAGQHGKGFAVVAEEVRNLAARSAKAAKETTDMIEGSIEKVNDGRNIAQKTADMLDTIVGNVGQVDELVSNIAKASKEQSLAIEQINQGVLQVSQVVQANSATAEESASASEQLSNQAESLRATAGRFKLGNETRANAARRVAPPAPVKRSNMMPKETAAATALAPVDEVMAEVKPEPVPAANVINETKPAPAPATRPVKPARIALTEEEGFGKY